MYKIISMAIIVSFFSLYEVNATYELEPAEILNEKLRPIEQRHAFDGFLESTGLTKKLGGKRLTSAEVNNEVVTAFDDYLGLKEALGQYVPSMSLELPHVRRVMYLAILEVAKRKS
jgi:hypothetical protein